MYYLDSNAFIYPALYEGPKASNSTAFLRSVVDGEAAAATASFTLDEVIWILSQNVSREGALVQDERILTHANFRILDIGSGELLRVVKLMDAHDHLTPRDGIHLATMLGHGIHSIVSDDEDFDDVAEVSRVGLDELPVSD